jgi:hypothetical protein
MKDESSMTRVRVQTSGSWTGSSFSILRADLPQAVQFVHNPSVEDKQQECDDPVLGLQMQLFHLSPVTTVGLLLVETTTP